MVDPQCLARVQGAACAESTSYQLAETGCISVELRIFSCFWSLVFAGFTNSHLTNYSYLFALVLIKSAWHFWCIATLYIFVKGRSNKLAPCLVLFLRSGYTSRFAPKLWGPYCNNVGICVEAWNAPLGIGVRLVQLFNVNFSYDAWSFH